MSLVVAIRDKDRFVLGADKQASTGMTKDHTSTKIWAVKGLPGAIMGGVGSARASQIIQYSEVIDKNSLDAGLNTDYIVNSLAPIIANTLTANGIKLQAPEESSCSMMPNAFIFAYADRAWMIWNDLSVTEIEDYIAIGSGSEVARGVLFATGKTKVFDRIAICIEAAADTTLFVDDAIDFLWTKDHKSDMKDVCKVYGIDPTETVVAVIPEVSPTEEEIQ